MYVHMTVLCACACVRACLSVMYAQGPLGNHRIWYDTTVTPRLAAARNVQLLF